MMPFVVGWAIGDLVRYVTGWVAPIRTDDAAILAVLVILAAVLDRRSRNAEREVLLDNLRIVRRMIGHGS